jgi:AraC-like DNA-binding protein
MVTPSSQAHDLTVHTVPGSQALHLIELLQRWDIPADQLLSDTSFTEASLEDPRTRLPVPVWAALIERARMLTGEPGLGIYLGLQKRVSKYGYLGFAAMNAATIREAIEIAVKFGPIFTTAISLTLEVEGSTAIISAHEHADWGSARDVGTFSFVIGLGRMFSALTKQELSRDRWVEFRIAEPSYFPRFAHLFPPARFDQPVQRVGFDAALLDQPLATPDRAALRLAREQCERELAQLGFSSSIAAQVRRCIVYDAGIRSLEQVAQLLRTSPRTLKRRLAEDSTTFSDLIESERQARALLLLRLSELSVDAIAQRLGYSTATNFARAFRRWTGTTPAAHRRELRP